MPLAEDTLLERRYRIDGLLARGGMGAIYRAFDTNLNTPVAIKENSFPTPERVAQFKQEALILARLRHPALPRVIHHFTVEGRQYLVMDFIEGENLWEIVERRQQPLPAGYALDYLSQVCDAVSYLHRQTPPIIHRDIKPQNIKITPQGQAVLVDFGIAKQVIDENSATQAGAQGITPGFSPPEQYQRGTTPASDIYSLGATLYAVLTGQRPPDSVSLMVGQSKFIPPETLNPGLSAAVSQAIAHAMQIDPARRPASVMVWQQELKTAATSLTVAGRESDSTIVQTPTPARLPASKPAPPPAPETTYWLVDATGVGYPVSSKPLTIGRHSEADITVEDLSVSRLHARLRLDNGRCMVMDNDSANGTFLNGRRLGSEWYPMNPGDLLAVGAARFYLTTTQPAKLASARPGPAPVPLPPPGPTTSPPPGPAAPPLAPSIRRPRRKWGATLLVVLLLALLGGGGYWLAASRQFAGVIAPILSPAGPTAPAVTLSPTAPPPEATSEPSAAPSATPTLAGLAPTVTPRSSTGDQIRRPASPTSAPPAAPTATLTPSPAAALLPTAAAVVAAGPTLIPVEAVETIELIGGREVLDVDINPRNPMEVFALVKGDGLYKSSSGGSAPWARLNVDAGGVVALVIDPTDPTRLYGPTWNAVLKSTDGGNTWDAKTNGLVSNRSVEVLAVDPTRPDNLYAGVGETLVVSSDGGESWSSSGYGIGLGVARFNRIVIDPFNADIIYVGGLAGSVYKSDNGGRNFVQMPFNTGEGVFGLAAHPTQKDVYLAGVNSATAGIIKTVNGWDFESVSAGLIYGGADSAYSAIVFAPGNPAIVYAGSGYEENLDAKGIFKSIDGGQTWSRINNGLSVHPGTGFPYYVKVIAVHPTNPDIVLVATGNGLFKSVDGGANWVLK
ncbi:MAG: protein kinase [Chloroflexota bacterium]